MSSIEEDARGEKGIRSEREKGKKTKKKIEKQA